MAQLVWTRTALRHLAEHHTYIAEDDPEAAGRVIERIRQAALRLEQWPMLGQQPQGKPYRRCTVPRIPYTIFYQFQDSRVYILAVRLTGRGQREVIKSVTFNLTKEYS